MKTKKIMTKVKSLLLAVLLGAPLTAAAQGIAINAANFPDENFRNYLLSQNYGADGVLTEAEIQGITTIDVSSKNISSLKGIEHFTALRTLTCYFNKLTSLDVSNNTALTWLWCNNNQLTSLNVANNTALTWLDCGYNQLTSLDVSNNTALTWLWCSGNQLTSLDVSNNTALTTLDCSSNQLTSLDVSNNTALEGLLCSGNPLPSLDVSNNTALTTLYCGGNQLTSLDVSNNTALTELSCSGNQLTSLDVSNNTALKVLYCYENKLTSLDVSNNTALTELWCYSNQLTSLDVSNTALTYLECYLNQIKGEAMDALIGSLPSNTTDNIYQLRVYYTDEDEGNVCTKSQVAAAKAKGWTPYYYEWGWKEYEGSDDTATSIALPEIESSNAPVYNLSGQKVTTPQKGGIYIIGGKKVVVK